MRTRPALLLLATAAALLAQPRTGRAGPPEAPAAADDLDAARWEVRRAAERALEKEGAAALAASASGAADPSRLTAWSKAVERRLQAGGPAAVDAIRRVLRRLETRATDDQVRLEPRLLRARLERLLPQVVTERSAPAPKPYESDGSGGPLRESAAYTSAVAVRGLFPEAREVLRAMLSTTEDARLLAGAVAALCGEEGKGPDDDETLAAIASAWEADPVRLESISDYRDADGFSPAAALAVAVALDGRAAALPRLRLRAGADDAGTVQAWLEQRLPRLGQGDLTLGAFLVRVQEGTAHPDDEAEAAQRALEGGLPWLARLCARRALFLDARHAAARAVLVRADEALSLAATARRDARASGPADPAVVDAPGAKAVDESLRAGRLSMRLSAQIDLGGSTSPGLVPAAVADGILVHGTARGRVVLADPETGQELAGESTGRIQNRPARGIAISNGVVAVVTNGGAVLFFAVEGEGLRGAGTLPGPFARVAAGPAGEFWFVGAHRTVWRSKGAGAAERVEKVATVRGFSTDGFAVLSDGALLVRGAAPRERATVVRIDPATGAETVLVTGDRASLRSAAFGADVLVAEGDAFRWLGPDGASKGGGPAPDGEGILGLAGDPASGLAYLTIPDGLAACAVKDGAVHWIEHVEGGGDAVVGGAFVLLSAGAGPNDGSTPGDSRTDRTLFVLRAGVDAIDPFGAPQRVKAVDLAVAAAGEGRTDVADALLDPVTGWLSTGERWAAANAIREARAKARRARGDVAPDAPRPMEDAPPEPDAPPAMDDGSPAPVPHGR